ncbi:hypothetical protein BLA24_33445 [Streptomyces cinnamoneus]|uniref:Secreted protein n=1 Tax=Streptomyces cinnamoneus TaxID=53446 RepID=A0A2G1XAQ0_STRCJ|nr:hypothetical protein [Streptomyces cinnamoneus]PHQ48308.1 hypothetical protein BLA24_33445 [Streptomyces cinnamoneus]PPT15939.1 hypothetical protein CYQ11_26495 [Streptomyces cinnamoneus]
MRRVVHALAWVLATGVAMAVSWYGVRTVLTDTAYEPPRALPISHTPARPPESAPPTTASVRPPSPPPPPSAPAASARPATPDPSPPASRAPSDGGGVRSYPVKGGRAVFDIGEKSATLVSATPDEGRQMRVWTQTAWIRVDFVAGTQTSSVFVTWNGHPPQVQTVEN